MVWPVWPSKIVPDVSGVWRHISWHLSGGVSGIWDRLLSLSMFVPFWSLSLSLPKALESPVLRQALQMTKNQSWTRTKSEYENWQLVKAGFENISKDNENRRNQFKNVWKRSKTWAKISRRQAHKANIRRQTRDSWWEVLHLAILLHYLQVNTSQVMQDFFHQQKYTRKTTKTTALRWWKQRQKKWNKVKRKRKTEVRKVTTRRKEPAMVRRQKKGSKSKMRRKKIEGKLTRKQRNCIKH